MAEGVVSEEISIEVNGVRGREWTGTGVHDGGADGEGERAAKESNELCSSHCGSVRSSIDGESV